MLTIFLLLIVFTIVNSAITFLICRYFFASIDKKNGETTTVMNGFSNAYKNLFSEVKKLHDRIDGIFVVDKPSPNEATQAAPEDDQLNENSIVNVPKDLKFEVEGGDSQVPPGYIEKD